MPPRPPPTQRSGSQTTGAPVGGWSLALVSRRKETQPTGLLPSGRKSDFYSLCYPQKPRRAAAPPAHYAHPAPIPRAVCHLPSVLRLRQPSLGSPPSKTGHPSSGPQRLVVPSLPPLQLVIPPLLCPPRACDSVGCPSPTYSRTFLSGPHQGSAQDRAGRNTVHPQPCELLSNRAGSRPLKLRAGTPG